MKPWAMTTQPWLVRGLAGRAIMPTDQEHDAVANAIAAGAARAQDARPVATGSDLDGKIISSACLPAG